MRSLIFLLYFFSFYQIKAQDKSIDLKKHLQTKPVKLLITGHRGGFYKDLPENSFAAFDYTTRKVCSLPIVLELDVKASEEGTLFVFHDDDLERTTNGQGKIALSNDIYLKSLFLKNEQGEVTKEKIPTFDSVLHFVKDKNVLLMVDVKASIWEKVIKTIQNHQLEHKCIILTFKKEDMRLVHSLTKKSQISVLISNENDWESIDGLKIPKQNLIAYINQNTPIELINKLRKIKIPLMTDVSEHKNEQLSPLQKDFYKNLVIKMKLNILITDFPVVVAGMWCN